MKIKILALVFALFLAGCGNLVEAEIEASEICKVFTDKKFPGVDVLSGITTTVNGSFVFDVGTDIPDLNDEHRTSEVRFLRAKLLPRTGVIDFGFIEKLTLDMAGGAPGTELPRVTVGTYERDPLNLTPATLDIEGTGEANLSPYIDERYVKVIAAVTGSLPAMDWAVDIELCFYVAGTYQRDSATD